MQMIYSRSTQTSRVTGGNHGDRRHLRVRANRVCNEKSYTYSCCGFSMAILDVQTTKKVHNSHRAVDAGIICLCLTFGGSMHM